jgi:quercetin dioxygenase-like cupin family protein
VIRCIRLWTGADNNSYFEEGVIDLNLKNDRGDVLSSVFTTQTISFQETSAAGKFEWHTAPVRQLVITLSGTLDFVTRNNEHFTINPGDILLAEDTTGTGHSWKLIGSAPWQRAYIVLAPGVTVSFKANQA